MYSERTSTQFRPRSPRRSEAASVSDLIDQMNQLNQTVSSMILDGLSQMVSGQAAQEPSRRVRHRKDCEEECPDCERDDCYCRCCIGDADLVVYSRLGERRVVPILLQNERRREKQIHLELGEFKTRGGDVMGVKGALLAPVDFTLAPCGEEQAILVIESQLTGDDTPGTTAAKQPRLRDVDECKVLYGDLKVEGCDIRPIRIALAFLPRDCDAFDIHCGCSCC